MRHRRSAYKSLGIACSRQGRIPAAIRQSFGQDAYPLLLVEVAIDLRS